MWVLIRNNGDFLTDKGFSPFAAHAKQLTPEQAERALLVHSDCGAYRVDDEGDRYKPEPLLGSPEFSNAA